MPFVLSCIEQTNLLAEQIDKGAKCVILMSHLGRPDGKHVKKYSLAPIAPVLQQRLGLPVTFVPECVGTAAEQASQTATTGSVILLENLRFHLEEEGSTKDSTGKKIKADKEAVAAFRASLTKLGDVYINDAFGTAHRAHSSMVGVQLPVRASGFLMRKELQAFSRVLESPKKPFVAILGGAKVSDKLPLINNLIDKCDSIIIGGGMAFTFKRVLNGMRIGSSIFDEPGSKLIQSIVQKAEQRNCKLILPTDFVIADKFSADAKTEVVDEKTGIKDGWLGLDIGPQSAITNTEVILAAKTIILNGPMGVFEFPAFATGTIAALHAVAAATKLGGAISIVGGGDSAAAAAKFGVSRFLSHVSTGGGASLELLEGKQLPGVVALTEILPSKL